MKNPQEETPQPEKTRPPLVPRGMRVQEEDGRLRVSRRWSVWVILGSSAISLIVGGILAAVIITHFSSNRPQPLPIWIWPLMAINLPILYTGIAALVNRTVFEISPDAVSIRHAPLPFFGNRTLARTAVRQIYCRKRRDPRYDIDSYELRAILHHGDEVVLLRNAGSKHHVTFLESQIERVMQIEDSPVEGEARKRRADRLKAAPQADPEAGPIITPALRREGLPTPEPPHSEAIKQDGRASAALSYRRRLDAPQFLSSLLAVPGTVAAGVFLAIKFGPGSSDPLPLWLFLLLGGVALLSLVHTLHWWLSEIHVDPARGIRSRFGHWIAWNEIVQIDYLVERQTTSSHRSATYSEQTGLGFRIRYRTGLTTKTLKIRWIADVAPLREQLRPRWEELREEGRRR